MKKKILLILIVLVSLGAAVVFGAAGINILVKNTASEFILQPENATELSNADCILVLGCLVRDGGTPSAMLEDRLRRGVELFQAGAAPKLLMSGDHGRTDYDEVDAMKSYAVDAGIADSDVFMDHAGFSTYESMYRAKEVFQVKRMIIVTQGYHLYRAVYIARMLGIEAYGVNADYRNYVGQTARDVREVLARVKDFANCIVKPEPTYLGDAIPIFGDGNLTNDKNSDFS